VPNGTAPCPCPLAHVRTLPIPHHRGMSNIHLRRVLGPWDLVLLGIGSVIGTGIFVLTGHTAAAYCGPAIVLAMVLAGAAALLAGLCYAELAAALPVAGSAYSYAREGFGALAAWVIGWDLILEYALAASTVAVGWSANLANLVNLRIGWMVPLPGGGRFDVAAALVVVAVTVVLVRGVRESAWLNGAVVVVKVAVIVAVIGAGALFVDPRHWRPFIPPAQGSWGHFGWGGVLRGAAVIFFAYIGFDAVSTAAQEARDPQRDMPRGLLGSLAICTVLYVLVSAVTVGLVPYPALDVAAPLATAIDAARGRAAGAWVPVLGGLALLVKLGTLLGLTSTMVVTLLAQSRIFYAMAEDGLLPAWAGRVHPRFHTPHLATAALGTAVALAAALTPIDVLSQLVSIGTLFAFVMASLAVIVLRRQRPDLPRPFRVPLSPWLPALAALVSGGLMLSLPAATWLRLAIWMALGLLIWTARRSGQPTRR
jgi:basic amino acid/polyamine antiporter, APA family